MPICPWCARRVWLWQANLYGGPCARCWRPEAVDHRADGTLADPRLEGVWRSDAERTVAEWREHRPLTDDGAARLKQLFGYLRVTYAGQQVAYDYLPSPFDGHGSAWTKLSTAGRFVVVARDAVSVVILGPYPGAAVPILSRVRFVDHNTYWTQIDLSPLREYFTRES